MIRWLLIALFFYILYKLITGQRSGSKNRNSGSFFGNNGSERNRRRKNLDHIEDAEFEDITPKEKKSK